MIATEEILARIGVVRGCFGFLRKARVERAVVEQIYLVERSTGRLLDQQIQPNALLPDDAARITAMVTCFMAFFRHPEQLAHYARLGHIQIDDRTYGICVSDHLVLLSVIRGSAGIQTRLADCRDRLTEAELAYAKR